VVWLMRLDRSAGGGRWVGGNVDARGVVFAALVTPAGGD